MKSILLTQGKIALVDDEDFNRLNVYKWYAYKKPNKNRLIWYAARSTAAIPHTLKMHREILGLHDPKIQVDHRNGDGLNNQKFNLRQALHGQNQQNMRKHVGCTSRFKGVYWHRQRGKWSAKIMVNRISRYLGLYTSEEDAARAYDKAAKCFFGEFALVNL